MRRAAALLCALGLLLGARADERAVDLRPDERAGWSLRNVVAWITTPFGGGSHWYREPVVRIEVVPADADVDLFYVRSNFQLMFVQAEAPVHVRLPRRLDSTSRDAVRVRVMAPGYTTWRKAWRVHEAPSKVLVELSPLPNALLAFDALHLAGRTTFTLRTSSEPQFRITKSEDNGRFTLALTATAQKLARPPAIRTPIVRNVELVQAGEDLLIHVESALGDLEVRSKGEYDVVREEHVFTIDLQEKGARPPSPNEIRERVARAAFDVGDPCLPELERTLVDGLGAGVISRAHRATGTSAALYQREAMLRLGRVHQGRVLRRSGGTLRTGSDFELALALQEAADVEGYVALLRAIARTEPEPDAFLHAVLAPELDVARLRSIVERADAAFEACAR